MTQTAATFSNREHWSGPGLDPTVHGRLTAAARSLRRLVLIEGAAFVVVFTFTAAVTQYLADYGSRGVRWSMRATLLAMTLASIAWLVWKRLIRPLRAAIQPADVANLLERRFPALSSVLISAVRFGSGEAGSEATNSRSLMAEVVRSAAPAVADLDFGAILDRTRVRWSALAIAATLALTAATLVAAPETVAIWFARDVLLRDVPWPRKTQLFVELRNGELIGARGDDLVIQAHAQGVAPRDVDFVYKTDPGRYGRETMVTVGSTGSYRFTFKNAQEDFWFQLEGGDDVTESFRARLLERPRVVRARLSVAPPAYTRLPLFSLGEEERAVQILPGSRISFDVETNKPVVRASLMAGTQSIGELAPGADRFQMSVTPVETATFHFQLLDDADLESKQATKIAIRVVKDDAPSVRLKAPGVGDMITAQALIPLELEFADTYGLARAEALFKLTRDEMREDLIVLPDFQPGGTNYSTSFTWNVAEQAPAPGDRIALRARAADFDDVNGPNVAESPEVVLRIVTVDEFLAELARREQEFRMDFERLTDAQERLRGELLSLMNPPAAPPDATGRADKAQTLERRQRSIAGSVNVIRQQVAQVLTELSINQLMTETVQERLGGKVADPLAGLSRRSLPEATDAFARWIQSPSDDLAARVDAQQVAVLSQMREILANMIQWEGYQEAVNMLRDVLRLQNELKKETQDAYEKQGSQLFDEKK
ncbi:MAG: hypothetical protein AABZ12_05945 [Planctomycetota bacterium]